MVLSLRQGSLRCEECDEQDFGVTLDRVPDVRLHVGGHGYGIVVDHRREDSVDTVVVSRRMLSVSCVDVPSSPSGRS